MADDSTSLFFLYWIGYLIRFIVWKKFTISDTIHKHFHCFWLNNFIKCYIYLLINVFLFLLFFPIFIFYFLFLLSRFSRQFCLIFFAVLIYFIQSSCFFYVPHLMSISFYIYFPFFFSFI